MEIKYTIAENRTVYPLFSKIGNRGEKGVNILKFDIKQPGDIAIQGGGSETYELDKPKIVLDYTVTEPSRYYTFTSNTYPDIEKCKWFYLVISSPDTVPGTYLQG